MEVGLRGRDHHAGVIEQLDRPAPQVRIHRRLVSVASNVVVDVAADGDRHEIQEVAEVQTGLIQAALGRKLVVVGIDRLGLGPAWHRNFGDDERGREQVVELVVPVRVAHGRRGDVPVRILEEYGPTLQARIARILVAVGVQVVKDVAGHTDELEVAEVEIGLAGAAGRRSAL